MRSYEIEVQNNPQMAESTIDSDDDLVCRMKNLQLREQFQPRLGNYNTSSKLKTELCRKYKQYGFCPYGEKCTFAHGPQQLKQNQAPNTLYKTKQCFAFFGKGYCKFGDRCNYLHSNIYECQTMKKQTNRRKWQTILGNHRQLIEQCRVKSRLFGIGA